MLDVMFYEAFEEEKQALKQYIPGDWRVGFSSRTIQQDGQRDVPARVISVRTQSRIPLVWAEALEGILTRSQGYDHLARYLRKSEVPVPCGYLPEYCARAVAEQAVWMMMALWRKARGQIRQLATFDRDGLSGRQCLGRRALVVGVGRIGRQIVDLARGLRMEVKGVDICHRENDLVYVPLSEGVAWAEVIFCALPLTDQTRAMINYEVLRGMPPGGLLINVGRGEVTPLNDARRLLEEARLAGLGLDVYPEEDKVADYLRGGTGVRTPSVEAVLDLKDRDDVLMTPHNAFNTQEAVQRKASESVTSLRYFWQRGVFPCPVVP